MPPARFYQKRTSLVWVERADRTHREVQFSIQQQLLHRNEKRFRGGLVFKAHRWTYHSILGSRVVKKKRRTVALVTTHPYVPDASISIVLSRMYRTCEVSCLSLGQSKSLSIRYKAVDPGAVEHFVSPSRRSRDGDSLERNPDQAGRDDRRGRRVDTS